MLTTGRVSIASVPVDLRQGELCETEKGEPVINAFVMYVKVILTAASPKNIAR